MKDCIVFIFKVKKTLSTLEISIRNYRIWLLIRRPPPQFIILHPKKNLKEKNRKKFFFVLHSRPRYSQHENLINHDNFLTD